MKKYILYGLSFITMILFVLMPVSASGLCFRLYLKEVTEPSCYLYYTTAEHPDYSEEQRVNGIYDEEKREVTFRLDGELAGKLTNLRLDFANCEQLIGIDGVSVSSAGVVKKQYQPAAFFENARLVLQNDIREIDLIPAGNMAYLLTGTEDPFLVFSDRVVKEFNGYFSHYRVSRALVCVFLVGVWLFFRFRPMRESSLQDLSAGRRSGEPAAQKGNTGFYMAALLGMVLAYFTYEIVLSQVGPVLSDYHGHLWVYLPLFYTENWWTGWMAVPYCMWHLVTIVFHSVFMLPLESAGAFASCFFGLLGYFVSYWMLDRVLLVLHAGGNGVKAAILSFGLSISQGLYGYWLDTFDGYLGIYSMNPLHNPTQMCVKPFALLAFCLVYDIFGAQKDPEYQGIFFRVEKGLKRYYFYLAGILLLSTLAKPTFAQMFIPAVGVIMLADWIGQLVRKRDTAGHYFKECLRMLLCAVPSLLYILVSYVAFFLMGGSVVESSGICVTKLGEVWSMYSENILLSVGLGMAFPLLILLIAPRFFLKDSLGRLALIGYAIGFAQALFLGERGEKLSHGNFIWPMLSGMTLLWMAAVIGLLCLEQDDTLTGWKRWLLGGAWMLFFAHVLCGYLYIRQLL